MDFNEEFVDDLFDEDFPPPYTQVCSIHCCFGSVADPFFLNQKAINQLLPFLPQHLTSSSHRILITSLQKQQSS